MIAVASFILIKVHKIHTRVHADCVSYHLQSVKNQYHQKGTNRAWPAKCRAGTILTVQTPFHSLALNVRMAPTYRPLAAGATSGQVDSPSSAAIFPRSYHWTAGSVNPPDDWPTRKVTGTMWRIRNRALPLGPLAPDGPSTRIATIWPRLTRSMEHGRLTRRYRYRSGPAKRPNRSSSTWCGSMKIW